MPRLAALSLALLLTLSACAKPPQNPAPAFDLPGVDGGRVSLGQFKGKVLLINFWATWCAPCREETPALVALQQKYRERGLAIVGLSLDESVGPVLKFREAFKVNYPMAIADLKTAKDYGKVLGLPVTFVVGRDGGIVKRYEGAVDVGKLEPDLLKLF